MPNENAKRKLVILGTKVQGRALNSLEESRLDRILASQPKPKTRSEARQLLVESLNASEIDVLLKLAGNDDNDRIIDDIINELNKPGS